MSALVVAKLSLAICLPKRADKFLTHFLVDSHAVIKFCNLHVKMLGYVALHLYHLIFRGLRPSESVGRFDFHFEFSVDSFTSHKH